MTIDLSTLKAKLIAGAILVGVFGLGYWAMPQKTITKTEIKEVIKEVVKIEKDSTKTENKNKDVVIVETTRPDGTKTKETHNVDKGSTVTDITEKMQKQIDQYKEQLSQKTTERSGMGLYIGAMAYSHISHIGSPEYGVIVTKRVIGAITGGAFVLQNHTTGLTLGVSF